MLCAAVLMSSGGASAAFLRETQDETTLTSEQTDETRVERVSTETQLKTAGTAAFWNDAAPQSAAGDRKILRLAKDITLHGHKDGATGTKTEDCDLLITADCNLDLNGKTLNLNGHTLTIRHDYHGTFSIYNGTVTNGTLKIETPNAAVDLADATVTAVVVQLALDDLDAMAEYLFSRVEDALYQGDAGGYFVEDLPLPQSYGPYPVTFRYTSSKPEAVDEAGVLHVQGMNGLTVVTLTLTLTFEDGTQKSRDFTLRVAPPASATDWCQVGVNQLFWKNYFAKYAGENDTYTVSNRVLLPVANRYIHDDAGNTLTYGYRVFDYANDTKGDEKSAYLIQMEDAVVLNSDLGSCTLWLECTATLGDVSYTAGGKVRINARTDISSIVKELFDAMYPDGEVVISFDGENYDYAQSVLVTDPEYAVGGATLASRGVTDISYRIYTGSQEEHDTYYIEANAVTNPSRYPEVQVRQGAVPDTLNIAVVEAQMSFGPTVHASVYLRVTYEDDTEDQNFAPYYAYLNSLMMTVRTNYLTTYTSFEMPSKIGRKPYVQYVLQAVNGAGEPISFDLSPYIEVQNVDPTTDASGAPAKFVIHTDKLPPEDIYVQVIYRYKFSSRGATAYKTYEDASTILTLPGMIQDPGVVSQDVNPQEIPDQNLYNAIYDQYGNQDQYTSALYGKEVNLIFTSALSDEKDTFTVTAGTTIGNLKGIEFLQNTKSIVLYNCGVTDSVLTGGEQYLNQLNFTELLDLGQNELTGWNTGGARWLSGMENLKVLKIDSNKIELFQNLTGYPALKEFWIFGQRVEPWRLVLFGITLLELNLYGEDGLLNTGAVASALADTNMKLYNAGTRDDPQSSNGSNNADVVATSGYLADMAVQEKKNPSASVDLSKIYGDSPRTRLYLNALGKVDRNFRSRTSISGNRIDIKLQYYYFFSWSDAGTPFSRTFTYTDDQTEIPYYTDPTG